MKLQPKVLSVITTHRCTAACVECCFGCSPGIETAIPVASIEQYIDDAADYGSFQMVVFTGGECFLLGNDLVDLVRRCTDHGFKSRVVTNGYWGESEKVAERRAKALAGAGLGEVNISTGPAHAEYVSLDSVQNAAVASHNAGLSVLIALEISDGMSFDANAMFSNREFESLVDAGKITILASPWMEFRDGTGPKIDNVAANTSRYNTGRCSSSLNVVAVTPTQKLISCCGLPMEDLPELAVGNLQTSSLGDLLSNSQNDLLRLWIHAEGPRAVFRAAEREGFVTGSLARGHICSECRDVYQDVGIADYLNSLNQESIDMIARRFSLVVLAEERRPNSEEGSIPIFPASPASSMCTGRDQVQKLVQITSTHP